jgi:hypothetical protein
MIIIHYYLFKIANIIIIIQNSELCIMKEKKTALTLPESGTCSEACAMRGFARVTFYTLAIGSITEEAKVVSMISLTISYAVAKESDILIACRLSV